MPPCWRIHVSDIWPPAPSPPALLLFIPHFTLLYFTFSFSLLFRQALSLVMETLGNLLKNLRPFVGIIVVRAKLIGSVDFFYTKLETSYPS